MFIVQILKQTHLQFVKSKCTDTVARTGTGTVARTGTGTVARTGTGTVAHTGPRKGTVKVKVQVLKHVKVQGKVL